MICKLGKLRRWFLYRFHPGYRFHVVNTGLKPGYYDKDMIMEAAIIKLLVDFFEDENPNEHWEDTQDRKELAELYNYYKNLNGEYPDEILDPELYKVFNKNLLRVVELRGLMWT